MSNYIWNHENLLNKNVKYVKLTLKRVLNPKHVVFESHARDEFPQITKIWKTNQSRGLKFQEFIHTPK
jgi:hypothetical protein